MAGIMNERSLQNKNKNVNILLLALSICTYMPLVMPTKGIILSKLGTAAANIT
jgi:hypothetical protein